MSVRYCVLALLSCHVFLLGLLFIYASTTFRLFIPIHFHCLILSLLVSFGITLSDLCLIRGCSLSPSLRLSVNVPYFAIFTISAGALMSILLFVAYKCLSANRLSVTLQVLISCMFACLVLAQNLLSTLSVSAAVPVPVERSSLSDGIENYWIGHWLVLG